MIDIAHPNDRETLAKTVFEIYNLSVQTGRSDDHIPVTAVLAAANSVTAALAAVK